MTQVQYLTDADFFSPTGNTMNVRVSGIVFVMFMADNCPYSRALVPVFERELPIREQRITFAMANVGNNRNIVLVSQTTSTPIKMVPSFILYVNGSPKAKYKGDKTLPNILSFLSKMMDTIGSSQQAFMPQQRMNTQEMRGPSADRGGINYLQPKESGINNQDIRRIANDSKLVPVGVIPHNAPYWNMMAH